MRLGFVNVRCSLRPNWNPSEVLPKTIGFKEGEYWCLRFELFASISISPF
jgi:hypothetical protein